MRNFYTFPTVYHLNRLDKRFKNYKENSAGYGIKFSRSEVHYRTPGSLPTCSDARFFWAEILRIEIIDMISVCPNRSPLRAIGNDMSLI